jgi:hypothetical protein
MPLYTTNVFVGFSLNLFLMHLLCSRGLWVDYCLWQVMVSYHRDLIGEDWVEPFYQGRSNTDLLQTQVEVHNLQVSPDTGTQLLADLKDQSVEFGVALHVLTRVRILNIITHHFRVHVRCDITVTPLTETNRQSTLLSKSCREKTHWLSNH